MSKVLYANITGVTRPISVRVNSTHGATTSVAQIECESHTLDISDSITIDLGYEGDHGLIFTGYVKQLEQTIKPNVYQITAHDILVRATDYFIASDNPNAPFTRRNVAAEDLVEDLLNMAGLPDPIVPAASNFTFGIYSDVEINLVTTFDFIKLISDVLAWSVWADQNGDIYFANRKPYVMVAGSPESSQPGFIADVPLTDQIIRGNTLDAVFMRSEKDLRNKVVVYGKAGTVATAEVESCFLPAGFRKTSVLSTDMIDDQSIAQLAANYNLSLYHRLAKVGSVEVEGNHEYLARKVVTLNATEINAEMTGDWYIFAADHQWSAEGYKTSLELRSFETC